MARRKSQSGPIAPAAASETGRFLVLMENLQSQVQALAEGQVTLQHGLTEMERRLRDDLRNEASVLRAAVAQNSADIRRLDARLGLVEANGQRVEANVQRVEANMQRVDQKLERMDQKLDRKVDRDEFVALASRVSALEHG